MMRFQVTIDDLPTFPDVTQSHHLIDGSYLPCPAEIRARCEEIRRTWSRRETIERSRWAHDRSRIPPALPTTPGHR